MAIKMKGKKKVGGNGLNQKILKFAKGNLMDLMKAVRIGFELETQNYDGLTASEIARGIRQKFDKAGYDAAVNEKVHAYLEQHGFEYFRRNYTSVDQFMQNIDDADGSITKKLFAKGMESFCKGFRLGTVNDVLENLKYYEPSILPSKDAFKTPAERPNFDESLIQRGTDGSVSGYEFRAAKPLTATEYRKAIKLLFNGKHKIDAKCSFHIHLSIDGIRHMYGPALQADMTDYILRHWSLLPENVQERMIDAGYYYPKVSTDKYSLVNFCGKYATWEFRCFGNVQNENEAAICLIFALRAMQYAYNAMLTRKQPATASDIETIGKHMIERYGRNKSMRAKWKQITSASAYQAKSDRKTRNAQVFAVS